MAGNTTDAEQIEMIKKWWKDYGKALTIAIVVGLILGFGWRYWHRYKTERAEKASMIYQAMLVANSRKELDVADRFAHDLISKYSSTPYATMASFVVAHNAVSQKKLGEALQQLQWVVKHSDTYSFRQIARIRAARVLVAQGKLKDALRYLSKVDDKTYMPMVENVKGDIYQAMGNAGAAKKAYQKAKIGFEALGVRAPLLALKLAQPMEQHPNS